MFHAPAESVNLGEWLARDGGGCRCSPGVKGTGDLGGLAGVRGRDESIDPKRTALLGHEGIPGTLRALEAVGGKKDEGDSRSSNGMWGGFLGVRGAVYTDAESGRDTPCRIARNPAASGISRTNLRSESVAPF